MPPLRSPTASDWLLSLVWFGVSARTRQSAKGSPLASRLAVSAWLLVLLSARAWLLVLLSALPPSSSSRTRTLSEAFLCQVARQNNQDDLGSSKVLARTP